MAMACMHQIPSRSRQDSAQATTKEGVAFCVKLGENNHTRTTTRFMRAHSAERTPPRESVSRLAVITAITAYYHRPCGISTSVRMPVGAICRNSIQTAYSGSAPPVRPPWAAYMYVQRVARPLVWASNFLNQVQRLCLTMPNGLDAEACRPSLIVDLDGG
ncbi:hypothetical protein LZ30DRAFT_232209 [Colletotrichum cereale]|nr:hypothetical protein LZ30DRAFT_232209 [Colletotrichum cereale]